MKTMNVHNLSIAALCPKEEARFTLNAIHITPEFTEATDGHFLMRVDKPDISQDSFPTIPDGNGGTLEPNEEPALLGTDECAVLCKALKMKTPIPVLATAALVRNGSARYVVATDLETVTKKAVMDGAVSFPDVDRAMPKAEDADFVIGFDVHLLARVFTQMARMSDKGKINTVTLRFEKPVIGKPIMGSSRVAYKPVRLEMRTAALQNVVAAMAPTTDIAADEFWKKKAKKKPAAKADDPDDPILATPAEIAECLPEAEGGIQ